MAVVRRRWRVADRLLFEACVRGSVFNLERAAGPDAVLTGWAISQIARAAPELHPHGIRIEDATIVGHLDLKYTQLTVPLILQNCVIKATTTARPLVDLGWAELKQPVILLGCTLQAPSPQATSRDRDGNLLLPAYDLDAAPTMVDLTRTTATWISVEECELDGAIRGDQVHTSRSVKFRRTRVAGPVEMRGASIGANLNLQGIQVRGLVIVDDAHVEANLDLSGAVVEGIKKFHLCEPKPRTGLGTSGAPALGVDPSGLDSENPAVAPAPVLRADRHHDIALSACRTTIKGTLIARAAEGDIDRLGPLWVERAFDLSNADVGHDLDGRAVHVGGDLLLRNVKVGADLRLEHARIGGTTIRADGLDVERSARFDDVIIGKPPEERSMVAVSPGEHPELDGEPLALDLYGASVGLKLSLRGASIHGPVGLSNATVSADLDLDLAGARIARQGPGIAVIGRALKVGDGISMHPMGAPGADGDSDGRRCWITGDVRFPALSVENDAVLSGVDIDGMLELTDATIGARLLLQGAALIPPGMNDLPARYEEARGRELPGIAAFAHDLPVALKAGRIEVTGDLVFDGREDASEVERFKARGRVDLRGARIGGRLDLRGSERFYNLDLRGGSCSRLSDSADVWPAPGAEALGLRSFEFDLADGDSLDTKQRLSIVQLQGIGQYWSPEPYEQLAAFYRRGGNESAAQKVTITKHWDELHHLRAMRIPHTLRRRFFRTLFGGFLGFGYRRYVGGLLLAFLIAVSWFAFWRFDQAGVMVPTKEQPADVACGAAYPCFNPLVYGADTVLPIIDFGQEGEWRPDTAVPGGSFAEWLQWSFILVGWVGTTLFVAAFTNLIKRD